MGWKIWMAELHHVCESKSNGSNDVALWRMSTCDGFTAGETSQSVGDIVFMPFVIKREEYLKQSFVGEKLS
ncbi:hypothetical protein IEQ34_011910 [Dendrobium chrysotoxum]|uniref:Uncharacterized protein n=1 Tax=Dendrobium chrysotoxum TaxID=161865 RepID=A0AAV7GSW8_DENCH|nr:hypothetical protein IEQ34_011910 [Dendrobium chrysotoxum]